MIQTILQIHPDNSNIASIFNFTSFISALALLAILYSITNVRYHFRIAITPFPIYKISFFAIAFIGISTLLTDLSFSEGWLIPILNNQPLIQAILGGIFLILVLTWIFFAFIFPSIFNRYNCKKFTTMLYVILNKGSDNELPVIADELGRSADRIINSCVNRHESTSKKVKNPTYKLYAHDLVLMIGHRKLCRHMISSAPGTAVEIFRSMSRHKKYGIPIGQFSVNISTEALINSDSPIYHEDDSIQSGLFGQIKPFSKAIYGDYKLIESLEHFTPLDIPLDLSLNLTAKQLSAYCRCTLITIENYLETSKYYNPFFSINRAIKIIKDSCRDVTKINDSIADQEDRDINNRLHISTSFPSKVATLLDKYWPKLGYSRVLMSKVEPKIENMETYDLIALNKDGQLTVYWIKNKKIFSRSFNIDAVKSIVEQLLVMDKESKNLKLIREIISQYGCTPEFLEFLPVFKTNKNIQHTIYDTLATFMFDIIFYASHVSSPPDLCWAIQYISVWDKFFNDYQDSKSMKIILLKLRRLIYESIIEMDRFPNYKSARILGICLNIMGLTPKKQYTSKNYHSLHLIVIRWVTKNFQTLYINYPDIAKVALQGNISYNAVTNELTRTYLVGMKRELNIVRLPLKTPNNSNK